MKPSEQILEDLCAQYQRDMLLLDTAKDVHNQAKSMVERAHRDVDRLESRMQKEPREERERFKDSLDRRWDAVQDARRQEILYGARVHDKQANVDRTIATIMRLTRLHFTQAQEYALATKYDLPDVDPEHYVTQARDDESHSQS